MKAYVLVQTDTRRRDVTDRIRALPQVVFAEDVSGPYDALAPVSYTHLTLPTNREV